MRFLNALQRKSSQQSKSSSSVCPLPSCQMSRHGHHSPFVPVAGRGGYQKILQLLGAEDECQEREIISLVSDNVDRWESDEGSSDEEENSPVQDRSRDCGVKKPLGRENFYSLEESSTGTHIYCMPIQTCASDIMYSSESTATYSSDLSSVDSPSSSEFCSKRWSRRYVKKYPPSGYALPLPPEFTFQQYAQSDRFPSVSDQMFSPNEPRCISFRGTSSLSPCLSPSRAVRCPRTWKQGQELGRGSFGKVYEGFNRETGSFFAVKISYDNDISPQIQQEVAVLSRLKHANIVQYLGSDVLPDGRLCIFLELMKSSLQTVLKKYQRLEENTIRIYTRQILHGLEYLHAEKTLHRDIKCANILVDNEGRVKLADFGVAKKLETSLANSCQGTAFYMAPEVIETSDKRKYGLPADIWSLGCTVLEMASGKPPWTDTNIMGLLVKLQSGELPPIPGALSSEAKKFIIRCLQKDSGRRPTASELLDDPFVVNAPDTISRDVLK